LKQIDSDMDKALAQGLKLLRAELKNTAIGFVKRDLLISLVAGSFAIAELLLKDVPPIVAGSVGIALLTAQFSDYRYKRNQTLANHPLGYLYATKKFTLY